MAKEGERKERRNIKRKRFFLKNDELTAGLYSYNFFGVANCGDNTKEYSTVSPGPRRENAARIEPSTKVNLSSSHSSSTSISNASWPPTLYRDTVTVKLAPSTKTFSSSSAPTGCLNSLVTDLRASTIARSTTSSLKTVVSVQANKNALANMISRN